VTAGPTSIASLDNPSASRRFARFVTRLELDDVPPPVVEKATLLVLDTLGSCLASSTMEFGRAVLETAERLGGVPESSLIGAKAKVGAASAVLAPDEAGEDFDAAERGAVQRALARAGGNVSEAARALRVSRATLHRKMNRLGVRPAR